MHTRRLAPGLIAVAWVLKFGDPHTKTDGWREVETFPTEVACEDERQDRAREVRDKATTAPSLEKVLTYYHCLHTK